MTSHHQLCPDVTVLCCLVAVACGAASIDVSVMSNSGQDALMTSPLVIQVLDMGFDYEQVRTVVHLNMVQSG